MNDYKTIAFDFSKAKTPENPDGLEVVTTNDHLVTIVATNYRAGKQWDHPILAVVHYEDRDCAYAFNIYGKCVPGRDYLLEGNLCLKEPIKQRRMTNQELSKWLREKPEEFREVTNKHNLIGSIHSYFEVYKNWAVAPDIMIRSNYGEWKEPLIEE